MVRASLRARSIRASCATAVRWPVGGMGASVSSATVPSTIQEPLSTLASSRQWKKSLLDRNTRARGGGPVKFCVGVETPSVKLAMARRSDDCRRRCSRAYRMSCRLQQAGDTRVLLEGTEKWRVGAITSRESLGMVAGACRPDFAQHPHLSHSLAPFEPLLLARATRAASESRVLCRVGVVTMLASWAFAVPVVAPPRSRSKVCHT